MSDVPTNPPFELPAAELKHSVRRSAVAVAVAQLASQLISLVGVAILLRLLLPADYGLVGMILPLVTFLRIFATLGLNVATVQRAEIRPEETSSLFWLNVLLGCATAGVAAILAPSLGALYAQPEAATQLRDLAWALAGTSILAALGAQHQALLERQIRLGLLGAIRITAQLLAVVAAVAAAFAGWGVWALVVQQYVEFGALAALLWWAEPWRPSLPGRGARIGGHLRLGGYFAAASVVFYVADNLDRVLVGRLVGPEAVGLYSLAYNIMIKPVYVVITPLVALVLTSLSRAANQPATRESLVVAYYRLLAVLLMPAAVGLVVTGSDVMQLLGGAAWKDAGPLLSVLSLGMFGQALVIVGVPILAAADRGGRLLAVAGAVAVVLCASYLIGWYYGQQHREPVLGVAWGYAVAVLVVIAAPYTWFCLKSAGYSLGDVLSALHRPALAAVAMGVAVWLAGNWLPIASPLARLAVLMPLGAILYAALAWKELVWLVAHTQQLLAARFAEPVNP
ncbi:MAG: lipopolysaccharide biosynthesis protein [Pirellulales bacterium]